MNHPPIIARGEWQSARDERLKAAGSPRDPVYSRQRLHDKSPA